MKMDVPVRNIVCTPFSESRKGSEAYRMSVKEAVLDVGQLYRDADMPAEAYRPDTRPGNALQLSPRANIDVPEQMGACSG